MHTQIPNGSRVSWTEFNGKTCTGKLICHVNDHRGNDSGYVEIRVDQEFYHTACHGNYEMHSGTVSRDVKMHNVAQIQH